MSVPWTNMLPPLPETVRSPRRAYRVVDDFEAELAAYTGAPHAVTVDSCTNAIFLALLHERLSHLDFGRGPLALDFGNHPVVSLPRHTYVGVLQAARNAGYHVDWHDEPWDDDYFLTFRVRDSARRIAVGMYEPGDLTCLSFHAAKQLALGHGGAILTDDDQAADWLRRARMDGRAPGDASPYATTPGYHCALDPPTAALGLWILARWTDALYQPPPLPADDYLDISHL